jgi:hypothetical protein
LGDSLRAFVYERNTVKLRIVRLAVPLMLGVLAAVGVATSSSAAPTGIPNVNTWQSLATSKCLDSAVDGHTYALPCNGGMYQKWESRGNSTVVDYATGRCLDSNWDGSVYTLPCNGGPFQVWTRSGDTWRNGATSMCLDGNGAGSIYTHECNGGSYQRWI